MSTPIGMQVGMPGPSSYKGQVNPALHPSYYGKFGGLNALDQFQRTLTEATPQVSSSEQFRLKLRHPLLSRKIRQHANSAAATGETYAQQLKMYSAIHSTLNGKDKRQLKALLEQGVLTSTETDNGHTTLYQLYSMLTTPRSPGYDAKVLVRETIETLYQPYAITQKFQPLSENAANKLLQMYNNQAPNWQSYPNNQPGKQLTWNDLNVENSATCVSSSLMYYMADKKPSELARHLNELTSPMNAFYEKVKLSELSPDDPSKAFEILKQRQIYYYMSGPDEVTVKVENPPAGIIRAMDSQHVPTGTKYRNAIQTAYQSSLTFLATRSYDPATDLRDAEDGGTSKGLTEDEKTFMERVIKDNGGVDSITYQVVNGKANPAPGEEGNAYLYGYTRSFQQTASDLLASLRIGEPIIIGITDTDETGTIVGGHEVTVVGATTDPKTGELKFVVADSDDNMPSLVIRSARELIPRIHHAGMPMQLANEINASIQSSNSFLVPDQTDAANFQLMAMQNGPYPPPPVPEPPVSNPAEPSVNAPPLQNTAPVVNWMPVVVNPGAMMPSPGSPMPQTPGPF